MKLRMMVVATVLLVVTLSGQAEASFIINVSQVGNDVVATGSGTLDILGLVFGGPGPAAPTVDASIGSLQLGPVATGVEYASISGPTSFGSGGSFLASSGSGDSVGLTGGTGALFVPFGYLTGTSLSDSATWDNTTIAKLGLTPGTYTWTWGISFFGDADSLTLNIVPEPSSLTMATAAAGILGLAAHLRRRKARKSRLSA